MQGHSLQLLVTVEIVPAVVMDLAELRGRGEVSFFGLRNTCRIPPLGFGGPAAVSAGSRGMIFAPGRRPRHLEARLCIRTTSAVLRHFAETTDHKTIIPGYLAGQSPLRKAEGC